jgi:peptidylprolyl isomerase/peptidyl-prolyl cis-trans isomerase B (cyclophilin B)
MSEEVPGVTASPSARDGKVCDVIRSPLHRSHRLHALAVVATIALAACGDDSTNTPAADGGGAAACAPADGSAPKTAQFTAEPPMCLVDGKTYVVTMDTNQGTLHINMRPDIAPHTVNSFVNLARYHYFDGTTCHRAIAGFVVQCGDPTASGTGGPGYEFADELDKIEPYQIGSVAMANSGPDTNGSQFFIITGPSGAALPAKYTLFGQVDPADMGIVTALDKLGNPQDGPPLSPIDIKTVTVAEK